MQNEGLDIFIDGVFDRNRALDGDEVVIALHPEEKWKVGIFLLDFLFNVSEYSDFNTSL